MAKKKSKKVEDTIGTPTMVLFPARNYCFRVLGKEYSIKVPRKGVYDDLAPDIFSEEDGEFNLYDEKSKVMYLPAISKVLHAVSKYPNLKVNQLFAPIALIFSKNEVEIVGQVLEMVEPNTK